MAIGGEVLEMLCSGKVWTIYGDDYDSIIWENDKPLITRAQFDAGFEQYDSWKADKDAAALTAKETAQAKLATLGLTTDDLKALGLGNN
jgi:hypothetical protein